MSTHSDLLTRAATVAPSSWNAEALTFEAIISTGAAVTRRDARGSFVEKLDVSAINPADLSGLPVLDGHRQGGSEHVLGAVVSARREGDTLVATIRMSNADDTKSARLKVAEGILRGVSIGYVVDEWLEVRG